MVEELEKGRTVGLYKEDFREIEGVYAGITTMSAAIESCKGGLIYVADTAVIKGDQASPLAVILSNRPGRDKPIRDGLFVRLFCPSTSSLSDNQYSMTR